MIVENFQKFQKIKIMAENANPIRRLLQRAKVNDPTYNQTKLSRDLRAIAVSKGWSGFSISDISTKQKEPHFQQNPKYEKYKEVIMEFAKRNRISMDGLFIDDNMSQASAALSGVWQLLMYSPVRQDARSRKPSEYIRRTLVKYEATSTADGSVHMVGNTTMRSGEYVRRGEFTYIKAFEHEEDTEFFAIFQKPSRRLQTEPSYQRGISLAVALGPKDFPHYPIVATRCVLRRLDLLTEQIARLPEHWKQSSELRAHYCGYNSLKELSKFNIDHVKHSKLKEDEKLLKEQFWHLTELVRMLDEDVRNENYGRWIYLRR